jgi:hypothetical protein
MLSSSAATSLPQTSYGSAKAVEVVERVEEAPEEVAVAHLEVRAYYSHRYAIADLTGKTGSSSSGSSSGSTAAGSRGSNVGGSTTTGSGVKPSYGGGRYYGGGATVPYTAGRSSPKGLATAGFLGVGALAFFPGLWLYGAYLYPYSHNYNFYNSTARTNQTKPVRCLCQQYSECGCDDNDDPSYLSGVVGNGSQAALNQTLVRVANVNGTDTIFLNGTLPNGTTASGGTASANAAGVKGVETMGWLVVGGAVAVAMSML